MKTNRLFQLQLAAALLLSTLNSQLSTVFAQGSLTPPGAPAATMKTLAQIEARTPISSAPFTISVSGSYYLTTNLTVSSGNAITIATNGVTLDLNGFTIASSAASATGNGILLNGSLGDITIFNGHIRSGVTNNAGVYSGSGFGYGIYYSGNPPVNVVVSKVSVAGVLFNGIYFNLGNATVVEACTVTTAGNDGIVASTIKGSVASDCGLMAIWGDQVADCRGISTGGYGVYANYTAQNCYGQSTSSFGLHAAAAQNCYGYSGSHYGLFATTALNCFGNSDTIGTGILAITAQNCYGQSISGGGDGLRALNTAMNCFGQSSSGIGLFANDVAIGCRGYSGSGTGLSAYIANSCRVAGGTTNITYKYNMP